MPTTKSARGAKAKPIQARDLGIDLEAGEEKELFKWFLACLLFGKPIQQAVVQRAFAQFVRDRLTSPQAILRAGWDKLVEELDKGHYVRFDYSTATKLLDVSRELLDSYGSVAALLSQARDARDLSDRLQEFKGVGPTTARIFVRDVEGLIGRN